MNKGTASTDKEPFLLGDEIGVTGMVTGISRDSHRSEVFANTAEVLISRDTG